MRSGQLRRLILLLLLVAPPCAGLAQVSDSAGRGALQPLPPALKRFIEARSQIRYADMLWTRARPGRTDALAETVICSLVADGEYAAMLLGGVQGVTGTDPQGRPVRDRPQGLLRERDGVWQTTMNQIEANRWPGGDAPVPVADLRTTGMTPYVTIAGPPSQVIPRIVRRYLGGAEFTQQREDSVYRVVARSIDRDARIVWYIDPAVGWNATRVELWSARQRRLAVESQYERTGDVFLPVSVAFYNAEGDVYCLDTVHEAEVNTDDLPRDLVPEHIGIEPGMTVYVFSKDGTAERLIYAGDHKLLPPDEFWRREAKGELRAGAKVAAARRGEPIATRVPDPKDVYRKILRLRQQRRKRADADPWLVYTQQFIERYRLDAEQRQKAMQILHECQLERDHYLRGRQRDIQALETALKQAQSAQQKQQLASQLQRLREPVVRIFERRLKPRLNRIPTRAQRRAAGPLDVATRPSAP